MSYEEMTRWIDMRFKITHDNLDYKPQTRDDPLGLALFAEGLCFEEPPPPVPDAPPDGASTQQAAELDVFANGKGKGKGKGDGRCHACNGEGHFARDCPSRPPVGPQDVECLGCNGRGHYRKDCLTASPT